MALRNHALEQRQHLQTLRDRKATNQEFVNGLRHLILGARYGDYITRHFGAGKIDFAIPLLFELVDLMHASDKFSMIQAIDHDGLGDELRVLHSTADLSVPRRLFF